MKAHSQNLLIALMLGIATVANAQTPMVQPTERIAGQVNADDFPSLQAAVDALGQTGGEVRLSAKTYLLHQPVRLKHRIRFQGIMDSKVRSSVTLITPAPDFKGDWLFETVPVPAKENADLNKDIFFFDLNLNGAERVSGIKAANVDGMRLERCRLASLKDGVVVTQVTDQPRPWSWDISPGAVFINNCIFRCSGTAIKLEYSTQNRIYANWFVSGTGVALHIKNSDKTWFLANEINTFTRSAIVLEDDGKPGNLITDIFLSHNWINAASPDRKYLELLPQGKSISRVQFIDNILIGNGSADTAALTDAGRNRFANNVATQPGFASQATGEVKIPKGAKQVVVQHGLYRQPNHVSVTFNSEPPKFWVTDRTAKTFTVHFSETVEAGEFTWRATTGL
ncbi:MAG: right-handed parallel beta-helix repeat-containing protein [Verrucomicrobiota bacterium]